MRVSGSNVLLKATPPSDGSVGAFEPLGARPINLNAMGYGLKDTMDTIRKAERLSSTISIENAERPTNFWYRVTGLTSYWHMYAYMDWLKSEVSILSTIILRATTEIFKYGLEFVAKFALKCEDCGYESQTMVCECPVCHSKRLRHPDETQKDYFKRPNGKSLLEEANDNGQTLADVFRAYAELEYLDNQAYLLCVTGDLVDEEGALIKAYPLEFICQDPKFVRFLYDDTGKIGSRYAFVREDRNSIVDFMEQSPDGSGNLNIRFKDDHGRVLYPACWQIGNNFGGTGRYWLYTQEEVYQDKWFTQSLIYGLPIWLDIQDDLLTWHYIEKHNLKKYKYGYVRKMVILPGFSDEDVEDITQGIQDILATNDNSIPIICTPPQLAGVAEMKAQTLELGTESSADLMQIKNDIRDRICAHGQLPNIFAGDVSASGGMNNESQQITLFDRALADKYDRVDRMCRWVLTWYPQITDWSLQLIRPSKSYIELKRRLDKIQEAQQMKGLGFTLNYQDGEFWYSDQPFEQDSQKANADVQGAQAEQQLAQMEPSRGLLPGDGEGPPDKGTMRREDPDVAGSKDEIELAEREAEGNLGARGWRRSRSRWASRSSG